MERAREIAKNHVVKIISQEVDKDHTHILFSANPNTNLLKFTNVLKSGTSKAIRHRYP